MSAVPALVSLEFDSVDAKRHYTLLVTIDHYTTLRIPLRSDSEELRDARQVLEAREG